MGKEEILRHNSRTVFACHEYLHKTLAPKCFDLSLRITNDPFSKALQAAGIDYEDFVLDYLISLNLKLEILDTSVPNKLWEQNSARAMMDNDIEIIYGASIGEHCEVELARLQNVKKVGDPLRVSRPDLLIKVGTSKTGYPIWAPVDIKSHNALGNSKSNTVHITRWPTFDPSDADIIQSQINENDAFQLAHYLRHLQALGLADGSTWAGILGKDESFIAWVDLNSTLIGTGEDAESIIDAYEFAFTEAVSIKDKALARQSNPSLPPVTIARRISACGMCEMRKVCRAEMEAYDSGAGHVTLLSNVTAGMANKNLNGIESIAKLAKAKDLNNIGKKAALRAQVWLNKTPVLLDPTKKFEIPAFDVEIDIDLENSQAALLEVESEDSTGRDALYMYGFGIHDRTVDRDWRSATLGYYDCYADTDEAEFEIFSQMWSRLESEVASAQAAGKSVGIFHYGNHEQMWWRKFAEFHGSKPGVPTLDFIEDFMGKYFVNLLLIARKVILPATGYSIKTLAPLAGFNWEVSGAGGDNSLLMYQKAISQKSSDQEKAEAIRWLREYNRDDIKATFAVRDYLRGLKL